MGRRVDVEDLVGISEIVERLDLKTKEAVKSWRRRYPDFPQPVARLAIGPVWSWTDIEKWAADPDLPRGSRANAPRAR